MRWNIKTWNKNKYETMNAIVEVNSYLASSHVIPPGVFMAYKIGTLAKNGLISNKILQ